MYQFAICVGLGIVAIICLIVIAFYNKKYVDFMIKSNGKPLKGKDYYYTLRQHYPNATELYEDIIVYIVGHDGLNAMRYDGILKVKDDVNGRITYRFANYN